ncbi:hypothetical protein F5Y19DRAFT_476563 [Xylariaceae sp. FL1651]|nr:hypothetical protein F5Y19DRAFT_476563 [Xylariaceae sp. FL1651]
MSCDTSPFWGSSGIDAFDVYDPRTPSPLNGPDNWECAFNHKEVLDSKTPLELPQVPVSYSYENQDQWLLDFRRLQSAHNRAQAAIVASTCTALVTAEYVDSSVIGDTAQSWSELRRYPHSTYSSEICGTSSGLEAPSFVHDGMIDCAISTPIRCSSPTDNQIIGEVCTTIGMTNDEVGGLTSSDNNQEQDLGVSDIEKAKKQLLDMEQGLRAETKRRITQTLEIFHLAIYSVASAQI